MQTRDQINDTFFKEEGETQPTITIITKSQSNQSIVNTTMPNFSEKYLVEKKEVWKNIIPHQKVYSDEKWAKIMVHTVPIRLFSTDDGLYLLGQEIETFNPGMKLMKTPQWLSSEENRENKLNGSVVIQLKDQKMAEKAIKFRLFLGGISVKAEKYRHQVI